MISGNPEQALSLQALQRLRAERDRAEAAERRLLEEQEKSAALLRLVELLQDESASLQRKWERTRDQPMPPPKPPPPPGGPDAKRFGVAANGQGVGPSSSVPPPAESALASAVASAFALPPAACAGLLVLRLESLESHGPDVSRSSEAPRFLELSIDEAAVRSHALAIGSEQPLAQAFCLPVRAEAVERRLGGSHNADYEAGSSRGASSGLGGALPLCAALCEADGDGGGRPVAIGVLHTHVPALSPFETTELTCELAASSLSLAYRDSLGRGGRGGHGGRGSHRPIPHSSGQRQQAVGGEEDIAWRAVWHRKRQVDSGEAAPPPSAAGDVPWVCSVRLTAEWRPMPTSAAPAPLAASGPRASSQACLYDPLGFSLDAEGSGPPLPPGLARGRSGSRADSLDAAKHIRSSVGGWWESDSLALSRWNAAICSCGCIDEIPPRRLRYLLAGGVPLQHRMHVWQSCSAAPLLRAEYRSTSSSSTPTADAADGAAGSDVADGGGPSRKGTASPTQYDASARVIEMDLLRTFPTHPFMDHAGAPLIPRLRRVLLAFACHVPQVSYCQGLNFVAAAMILHGDELGAFSLLVHLCKAMLPHFHTPRMRGLHTAQAALISALHSTLPDVYARLSSEGVPIKEQTTAWLLCAFIDALPFETTLRLWDLLFLDGQLSLLRTAVAAFTLHSDQLLVSPDVFDLRLVLACDAAELVAASLAPSLQRCVAEAFSAASLAAAAAAAAEAKDELQ
jgi:hypothetical protein